MIKEAIYIKSIRYLKDEPEPKPQFLLLGRSNVGKSSFINALTHRKNLARISNTPGKTVLLNYYLINNHFYLVDAPGYGYARRSKTQKDDFIMMIEAYLQNQAHLFAVFLLIDFKVGPTKDDLDMFLYLKSLNRNVYVIATKLDKIKSTHRYKQEKTILETLGNPKHFYKISNVTKSGIDTIEKLLTQEIFKERTPDDISGV